MTATVLLILYFCGIYLFAFLPLELIYPVSFISGSIICAGVVLRKILSK